MPGTFAALDSGFPNLNGGDSTENKLRAIQDYLYQLLEQLRYTLNNLGTENFNETGLNEITEPVRKELKDLDGNVALLELTAAGLTSRMSDAEGNISTMQHTAAGFQLEVEGSYAPEWVSQTAYIVGDIVKVTTTTGSEVTAVQNYQCRQAHTSANNNKPGTTGGASYWNAVDADTVVSSRFTQTAGQIATRVTRSDMESAITQSAGDIMLGVRGEYANEWASGKAYYKNDVVKLSTLSGVKVTAVSFYKAKLDHTSDNNKKPPNATYWDAIQNANVQSVIDVNLGGLTLSYDAGQSSTNTPYITLNKDGTTIGGGPVYIGELNADTITAGTLDAANIKLRNEFTAEVINGDDDTVHDCGKIGTTWTKTGVRDHYRMHIGSAGSVRSGESSITFENEEITIYADKWDDANQRTDYVQLDISPSGITATRVYNGVTKTVDLFNL